MTQGQQQPSPVSQMFATPEGIKLISSLVKLSEGLQGLSEFLSTVYLSEHASAAPTTQVAPTPSLGPSSSKSVPELKPQKETVETEIETEEMKKSKKEQKKKVPRDPNAPKWPTSAYLLFQNNQRATLKAENASLSNTELMQLISAKWKAMPEEEKKPYLATYESAKENYKTQLEAYKKGQLNGGNGPIVSFTSVPSIPVAQQEADTSSSSSESSMVIEAPRPPILAPPLPVIPSTPLSSEHKKKKKKRQSMAPDETSNVTLIDSSSPAIGNQVSTTAEPPKKKKKKSKKDVPTPMVSASSFS